MDDGDSADMDMDEEKAEPTNPADTLVSIEDNEDGENDLDLMDVVEEVEEKDDRSLTPIVKRWGRSRPLADTRSDKPNLQLACTDFDKNSIILEAINHCVVTFLQTVNYLDDFDPFQSLVLRTSKKSWFTVTTFRAVIAFKKRCEQYGGVQHAEVLSPILDRMSDSQILLQLAKWSCSRSVDRYPQLVAATTPPVGKQFASSPRRCSVRHIHD